MPTLILSGAQDLSTPTSNARQVAALIPDAQLLVVPYTGHSVIGSDFSGCAAAAVDGVLRRSPGAAVRGEHRPASAHAARADEARRRARPAGLGGRPGRTLTAVLDAIVDLNRQVIAATLQASSELPSGSSFGGLRGGYARLTTSAAILKHFSFVPGVELSGRLPGEERRAAAGDDTHLGQRSLAGHGAGRLGQAGHRHPRRAGAST